MDLLFTHPEVAGGAVVWVLSPMAQGTGVTLDGGRTAPGSLRTAVAFLFSSHAVTD